MPAAVLCCRWDGDFQLVQQLLGCGALGRLVEYESHFDRWALRPAAAFALYACNTDRQLVCSLHHCNLLAVSCAQTCSAAPVYWLLLVMSCVVTRQQMEGHQHTSTVADRRGVVTSSSAISATGCRFRNAVKPGWKEQDLPGSGLLYDLGELVKLALRAPGSTSPVSDQA
jgi:hypothetical protein